MLQQTQALRVVPYYERWLDRFPDPESLAVAPARDVLELWSGLGYNRRALALQRAAEAFDRHIDPEVPRIVLVDTFKDEAEESLRVADALGDRLWAVRLDTPSERGRGPRGRARGRRGPPGRIPRRLGRGGARIGGGSWAR